MSGGGRAAGPSRRALIAGAAAMTVSPARAETGFYVPAEEAPHEATLMQWPVTSEVYWRRGFRDAVQAKIAEIANAVAEFEPVVMLAEGRHHEAIRKQITAKIELWDIPTDDLWARDSGPIFMIDGSGRRAVSHIRFNGWGGKQGHLNDGRIAAAVADRLGLPLIKNGLYGEAGGVEQDGRGLLIAHESSWVIDNRNPGLTRDEVVARLLDAYGADRMIWAPGLKGEDITDYHIDGLARLTPSGGVLANLPVDPDPRDPFHRAAQQTVGILRGAGLEVDVIAEPVARRVASPDFVASYVNYYVCNGAVIGAAFGDDETDAEATAALRRHYPGREVVTLDVDLLGELGGGVHCATQQIPAA